MATDIKMTIHPENYQSLIALLQMLKFGGTDTRDGVGACPGTDCIAVVRRVHRRLERQFWIVRTQTVVSVVPVGIKIDVRHSPPAQA